MLGIFKKKVIEEEDPLPEEGPVDQYEYNRAGFISLCEDGQIIDVYDAQRVFLCSAVIVEHSAKTMLFQRPPAIIQFPLLDPESTVYLQGCGKDFRTLEARGIVRESTKTKLAIWDLHQPDLPHRRAYFRQRVGNEVQLFRTAPGVDEKPIPCTLIDISLEGASIHTECELPVESVIWLRVELYPKAGPVSFRAQVVREMDGLYNYGVLFEQLDARRLRDLQDDIKQFQQRYYLR